jgi:hypothetical protein
VITKDRSTLQGRKGTVLVPPASPPPCDPGDPASIEGICIHGDATFSEEAPPVVTRYVRGVNVTGFTVRGFPGGGILVLAGRRTRIAYNKLEDNGEYGAVAFFSNGTRMIRNTASGSDEAGLYVGDSAKANAVLIGNRVSDHTLGIFVRDAERGLIVANRIRGNCAGILFLGDAPGPVGRFVVVANRINANNKFCPGSGGDEGFPAISGEGIDLFGANHLTIAANKVLDNTPSGPSSGPPIGGGVKVVAGTTTPSSSNRVIGNQIRGNQPLDLSGTARAAATALPQTAVARASPPDSAESDARLPAGQPAGGSSGQRPCSSKKRRAASSSSRSRSPLLPMRKRTLATITTPAEPRKRIPAWKPV